MKKDVIKQRKPMPGDIPPQICCALWVAVLLHAMKNAAKYVRKLKQKKRLTKTDELRIQDYRWLMQEHTGVREVCGTCGVDIRKVRESINNGNVLKLVGSK